MSLPLHYIDIRAFCYATEAESRVESALRTLLPEDVEIERSAGEGHHGDPIVILQARVERAPAIEHVFERLQDGIELAGLEAELEDRVDENNSLFLQVDKQAAAQGSVRLGDGITVRAKIEAYPAKREKAIENVRDALA